MIKASRVCHCSGTVLPLWSCRPRPGRASLSVGSRWIGHALYGDYRLKSATLPHFQEKNLPQHGRFLKSSEIGSIGAIRSLPSRAWPRASKTAPMCLFRSTEQFNTANDTCGPASLKFGCTGLKCESGCEN